MYVDLGFCGWDDGASPIAVNLTLGNMSESFPQVGNMSFVISG